MKLYCHRCEESRKVIQFGRNYYCWICVVRNGGVENIKGLRKSKIGK